MFGVKKLFITSALAVIFVNVAGAEEFKPSRVVHTQTDESDITQTITELKYDDSGRLVKFIEYEAGDEADPRFDLDIVWGDNEVTASGLIDFDETNVVICLGSNGLANEIVCDAVRVVCAYSENRLESVTYDDETVYFTYSGNELQRVDNSYGESIAFGYESNKTKCNIPMPVIWHNILFYYRFAVYAGLLGCPAESFPSEYNRYGNGWIGLDYTFDKDGNPTRIYSNGGMTHSSFDSEEFVYVYTKTNSVESIDKESIGFIVKGNTLRITGKDANEYVALYDVTGRLVKKSQSDEIDLPDDGIYILRVGHIVYKIKV